MLKILWESGFFPHGNAPSPVDCVPAKVLTPLRLPLSIGSGDRMNSKHLAALVASIALSTGS
ncbi:MAG TPA: hypothetical protein VGH65_05105, partial [Verrucomicrobiaceae bacterium]